MTFFGVVSKLLGVAFLTAGLGTNATYLITQATSLRDAIVMGVATVACEGLVALAPYGITRAWQARSFGHVLMGLFGFAACLVMVWLGAVGFAHLNIGDSAASRAAVIAERSLQETDRIKFRAERDRIEVKATSKDAVDAAWEQVEANCRHENQTCIKFRTAHKALAGNLAAQDRAAYLDGEIRRLDVELAKPTIAKSADPQVDAAIIFVSQISRGGMTLDPRDVIVMRNFIFALFPFFAGLCFSWGGLSGERRRP